MNRRLLYVLLDYPVAGETFIQREIDALAGRGRQLSVWSVRAGRLVACFNQDCPAGCAPARTVGDGSGGAPVKWSRASRSWLAARWRVPRTIPPLLRRFRQWPGLSRTAGRYDLVHAHFASLPADLAALAATAAGRPFTCSVHAWDVFAQSPALIRTRLAPAAAVASCTMAGITAMRQAGLPQERLRLIRHGLPLADYPFRQYRGGQHILAMGRLVAKKGFDILIDAYALLRQDCRNVPPLLLVGDGPLRQPLQDQVRLAGMSQCVRFAGRVPPAETIAFLQRASLLVLPGRRLPDGDRDGVANVLLEAMAVGTPVVTTTAGAAGEVFDGRHALLVPADNPAALAAALRQIIENPDAARQRASAARKKIEQEFDIERNIIPLEQMFDKAAAGG